MFQYEKAKELYEELKTKADRIQDSDIKELYDDFLKSTVDYSKCRVRWAFMDKDERMSDDKSRSMKHDAYMMMLGAVCRNLDIEGIDEIMPDRKTKGDFACYITMFLGLEQR